jgi:tetratricopeptide (TPR) repeat protein
MSLRLSPAILRLCAAAIFVAFVAASPARAQANLFTPDERICLRMTPQGPTQTIRSCTAVIVSPSTDPVTRANAYFMRGLNLFLVGQPQRALDDINEYFRRHPNMPAENRSSALAMRAHIYSALGQYDLAIADLDQALRLDPSEALAIYTARALVHFFKRDYDRAIADFDRALALNPRDADLTEVRGRAYAMKGDYVRALADYEAALRLQPNDWSAIGNRGLAHLRLGNYDQAIADLNRALYLKPDWAWAREGLREALAAKQAVAQRRPETGAPVLARRVALVIGNGRYEHIARLSNAENDAADIAVAMSAMGFKVYGYPKINFTRAAMETEIEAFQQAAAGADTAFIWYAGHGQEFAEKDDTGRNWLIPVDGRMDRPSDVYTQGIAMSRLLTAAEPARLLRIVVIDACRNSNLPSATRAIAPRLAIEQRSGMMIVFSTRSGTVALDGEGRNSPFAAAFLDAARDKSHLDVRQFFGAVARGTLERTKNAQEPELLVRLQTEALLPLVP